MKFQTDHRPWPIPARPFMMHQTWYDLAFMHWPVDPSVIAPLIHKSLEVDTFDGSAWIGVVPFAMKGIRHRLLPEIPGTSAFLELNVRTYVRHREKSGGWFFSRDAENLLAVVGARTFFQLPYYHASMSQRREGSGFRYSSRRIHRGARGCEFAAVYAPAGDVHNSEPGSLDAFLTERYALFTSDRAGNLRIGEIHHDPWELQACEAEILSNTMLHALGINQPGSKPILHFARRIDAIIWSLEKIAVR
jgi:uncharacterized protein YqjF (DUF2071 family)